MNGPDYRTPAEYFRDLAWAKHRAELDGTEEPPRLDEDEDDEE